MICVEGWNERGDWLARFSQDTERSGADLSLFLEPSHRLKAGVRVYDLADFGDVRRDEVCLWWEDDRRCWVAVRGRIRRLDVQQDQAAGPPPAHAAIAEVVEPEDEDDDVTMRIDVWNKEETLIGRFEQDRARGALYLARAEAPMLRALVHVYDLDEWGDVRPDEIHVWWEGDRCWVEVRGRRRYIDDGNTRQPSSGVNRSQFVKNREAYWKQQAREDRAKQVAEVNKA